MCRPRLHCATSVAMCIAATPSFYVASATRVAARRHRSFSHDRSPFSPAMQSYWKRLPLDVVALSCFSHRYIVSSADIPDVYAHARNCRVGVGVSPFCHAGTHASILCTTYVKRTHRNRSSAAHNSYTCLLYWPPSETRSRRETRTCRRRLCACAFVHRELVACFRVRAWKNNNAVARSLAS